MKSWLTGWAPRLWMSSGSAQTPPDSHEIPLPDVIWALGSVCALNRRAFDAQLLLRELPPPPLTTDALITAARSLGFRIQRQAVSRRALAQLTLPCVVALWDDTPQPQAAASEDPPAESACSEPAAAQAATQPGALPRTARLALVVEMNDSQVMLFRAGDQSGLEVILRGLRARIHRHGVSAGLGRGTPPGSG